MPDTTVHPLDLTIGYLSAALDRAAQAFLDDVLYHMRRGMPLDEAALIASNNAARIRLLAQGVTLGWQSAWHTTGQLVLAALKQRPEFRQAIASLKARHVPIAQLAGLPQPQPAYTTPPPLQFPGDWRSWEETHPPGGPATSRRTWEWLAEHEARLQQFTPTEYIGRYVQQRVPPLAGITDRALLDATRNISAGIAERGFGVRESMTALRAQFPEFTQARLENIARTEGAVLFETGRLARYREDAEVVDGVRFDAVGDSRTTEICRWHNNRCYRLTDPALPQPPLHYACRSTLAPILFDESPRWNEAVPPKEALPLSGFGRQDYGVLPPIVETRPG